MKQSQLFQTHKRLCLKTFEKSPLAIPVKKLFSKSRILKRLCLDLIVDQISNNFFSKLDKSQEEKINSALVHSNLVPSYIIKSYVFHSC